MDNSIDNLLESLKDTTYQSKYILQEGTNAIDRILQLQARLSGAVDGSPISITAKDRELIDKVKQIRINYDYRIVSYSNIHNQKKYDIHAGCNVDFVIEAILKHMDNPSDTFNPKRINEEAICKTFKKLTNTSYIEKSMNTDEFRYQYRSVAFGTFRRVMVLPNVIQLTKLYERTPFIVNYINNRLIFKHINSLNTYYKSVEEKFNKLAKNDPNLNTSLNRYLACLDTAIRNTLIMYKAIRSTFLELNTEYRNIFGELIGIDNELASKSLDESTVKFYNSIFSEVDTLTETINNCGSTLNEDTSNNKKVELSNNISKSFKSLVSEFETEAVINYNRRRITLENIKDVYGIISRISNEDLININNEYRIYPNIINKIDMENFISSLDNKIDFCKSQFYELINKEVITDITKEGILKSILQDTSFWTEIPEDKKFNTIGYLMDSVKEKLLNKPIITKINNLEYTFDNIVNIPDYCKRINDHITDINLVIIELMHEVLKIDNKEKIEIVINNLIRSYIGYSSIISCIFYTLLKLENKSIELVQNLIDDIN